MTDTRVDPLADSIEQIMEDSLHSGDLFICRCCNQAITSEGQSTEIGKSHYFRFTNPLGVSFNIACFRNAPGCSLMGNATVDNSWFAGYRWQIAVCAECQEHLGWYYQNLKQRYFFGLIPERLHHLKNVGSSQ